MSRYYCSSESLEKDRKCLISLSNEKVKCSKRLKEIAEEERELQKRIQALNGERTIVNATLTDLNLKWKGKKEMIDHAVFVVPIIVDDQTGFTLANGLVNLNRDIIMKLIKIIEIGKKIRNIIGMTNKFYEWSKQPIFRWARKTDLTWSYFHKSGGIQVSKNGKIAKAIGLQGKHIVLLRGRKITEGNVTLFIQIEHVSGTNGQCSFGGLLELPRTYAEGFAFSYPGGSLNGWGTSSAVHVMSGDIVSMEIDVEKGNADIEKNGANVFSLRNNGNLKQGFYLAAQLETAGMELGIISAKYW